MQEESGEENTEHVEKEADGKIIITEWKIFYNSKVPPGPPDGIAKSSETNIDIC